MTTTITASNSEATTVGAAAELRHHGVREVSLGCFFIIIGGGHRLVDRFEIRKILFIHSSWAFASASFLSLYIIDVLLVPWLSSSR